MSFYVCLSVQHFFVLFFIIIFDHYFLFQNNFFNLQINFVWDIFLIA